LLGVWNTNKDGRRYKYKKQVLRFAKDDNSQRYGFGFDLHWWRRLDMAREIDWTDAEEIGILLQETYPEIEPYSVRFTDLHKYVIGLPGFVGDPAKSNEGILEAIQAAWNEEWEEAK
jgi:FeS assembly protein IscX